MKLTTAVMTLVCMAIWTPAASGADVPATRPDGRELRQASIEQLIDRLSEISSDEFTVRSNILVKGPDAQGRLPQGLLRLYDPEPPLPQAMTELVERGLAALPQLLAHLDDARKTRINAQSLAAGLTYDANYDWNPRTARVYPAELFREDLKVNGPLDPHEYTPAIGDICFAIIGQIVNRNFKPLGYRPTAIVTVTSPLLVPDLCDVVRKEWSGLTPQRHRELLVMDVTKPDKKLRDAGGIRALLRYYPVDAPAAIKQRLELPFYSERTVEDFANQRLYQTLDARERSRLVDEFVRKNGPGYREGLLLQLWRDRGYNQPIRYGSIRSVPVAPIQILRELEPDGDPLRPPAVDAVAELDTVRFVQSLIGVESPAIDEIVWGAFRKYSVNHGGTWEIEDFIADACVRCLAHKGRDAELLAFCKRRNAELQQPYPEDRGMDMHIAVEALIQLLEAK